MWSSRIRLSAVSFRTGVRFFVGFQILHMVKRLNDQCDVARELRAPILGRTQPSYYDAQSRARGVFAFTVQPVPTRLLESGLHLDDGNQCSCVETDLFL